MKIGILTFHRAINYGAVLQCYGLFETLKSKGHDVEIIDYRPDYIERYRNRISWFDIKQRKGIIGKSRQLISSVLKGSSKVEASKRFDVFLKRAFVCSKAVTRGDEIPTYYDAIVFGSDQIWSPQICYGFDSIYWGQFEHKGTRLVTYAASIGGHNHFNKNEWSRVGVFLQAFERISVREKQLQEDIRKEIGLESELVVDPTILAGRDVFDKIAVRPKVLPDNYVLIFSVAPTDNLYGFAEKIASQTKSKIVVLTANKKKVRVGGVPYININPTVQEFLGCIKYARCVVTVSFHGTVFSVLFHKNFYSLTNYMQDRAEQFLRIAGLSERLVSSDEKTMAKLNFSDIDYREVDKRLADERKSSIDFINSI